MANEIISIENFPASNIGEITKLAADANAGQAVATVENTDGLSINDYLCVGPLGGETSQILQISSISGLDITFTGTLTAKHYDNEPVTKIKANQAKIYRAVNVDGNTPADASFSTLVATLTIQADQLYTEYTDNVGGSGYWWKYIFYNSTTLASTDLADAVALRGGGYGLYTNVQDVRQEAGLLNNKWITDPNVHSKILAAQSEVNASLLIGGYTMPLADPVSEVVVNATRLLAAGYLLVQDYGPEHEGTNKDGQAKIKMARDILAKFETGDTPLIDGGGAVSVSQTSKVRGYPDENAAYASPSEARMFSVTDRF